MSLSTQVLALRKDNFNGKIHNDLLNKLEKQEKLNNAEHSNSFIKTFFNYIDSGPKIDVLIKVTDENNLKKVADAISKQGGIVKGQFKLGDVVSASMPVSKLRSISQDQSIDSVWPVTEYHLLLDQSVPQISAPSAWQLNYTGKGIKVAVIDSGVDKNHLDLRGRVIAENDFVPPTSIGYDGIENGDGDSDSIATDTGGHGTHVAGTIAGNGTRYRGVAPEAEILAAKVFGNHNADDEWIIAAINWAVNSGANVISMSLGKTINEDGLLNDAVRDAIANNVTVVIASGNAGYNVAVSPANTEEAITVGAVDKSNNWAIFSSGYNYGSYIKPDVVAPGVNIVAARAAGTDMYLGQRGYIPGSNIVDNIYYKADGTSMATPHVSGVVALLLQMNKSLTPREVKSLLEATAAPKGDPGKDIKYGSGIVNVADLFSAYLDTKKDYNITYPEIVYLHSDVQVFVNTSSSDISNISMVVAKPSQQKTNVDYTSISSNSWKAIYQETDEIGLYTMTISITDRYGRIFTVEKSFDVFKFNSKEGYVDQIIIPQHIPHNGTLTLQAILKNDGNSAINVMTEAQILDNNLMVASINKQNNTVDPQSGLVIEFNWTADADLGEKQIRIIATYDGYSLIKEKTFYLIDQADPVIGDITFKNSLNKNDPALIEVEVYELSNVTALLHLRDTDGITHDLPAKQFTKYGGALTLVATYEDTSKTGDYTFNFDVCDSTNLCATSNTASFRVNDCSKPGVLIISTELGNYTTLFSDGLAGNYCVSSWNKLKSDMPSLGYLNKFTAAILSTGTRANTPLSESDSGLLLEYLGAGGNLVVEGSNIVYDNRFNDNFTKVTKANFDKKLEFDENNTGQIIGTYPHPLFKGLQLDQIMLDASGTSLAPMDGARELGKWNDAASSIVAYNSDRSKVVTFGFSLSELDPVIFYAMMQNMMNWLFTSNNNADLSVKDINYGYLIQGSNAINIILGNNGQLDATNAKVDILVDDIVVQSLNIDVAHNDEKIVPVSLNLAAGKHVIKIVLNDDFNLVENDYLNNLKAFDVSVATVEADLIPSYLNWQINPANITFTVNISNIGGANADNAIVDLYANNNLIGSSAVSLEAGKSAVTNSYLQVDKNINEIFNVTVVVNQNHQIIESDYSNNLLSSKLYLCNKSKVFIVEDSDASESLTNYSSSLEKIDSVLKESGYCTTTWKENEKGTPSLANLDGYDLVIWSAGSYWDGVINNNDTELLYNYTGNILFEGADIAFDHKKDDFLANYLHAVFDSDIAIENNLTLNLSNHTIFKDIPELKFNKSRGSYPDSVIPIGNSTSLAQWNNSNSAILSFKNGTTNLLYFAFSVNSIDNDESSRRLITNAVEYLTYKEFIPNNPPILNAINDITVDEDNLVIITAVALDPDGDILNYSINDTRFNDSDDANNVFTWQTTYSDAGIYFVNVTASDGESSDSKIVKITVNNVNRAPALNNLPDLDINETEVALITAIATDLDGDSITYSVNDTRFTQQDNLFGWLTTYSDSGVYNIKITATDGTSSDSKVFRLSVSNVNRKPTLAALSDINIDENQLVTITASATDQDNDAITYTINDSRFTQTNNIFTWQTDYTSMGTYNLNVTVTDGNLSDSKTFKVTVNNINRKPALDIIADATFSENSLIIITASATDADNDALTYAINDSRFVQDNVNKNKFTWQTSYVDAGIYNLLITVSDGSLSDSKTFKVTVNNVNRAPVLNTISDLLVNENQLATITASATDSDNDALTYTINDTRFTQDIINKNIFTWTPGYDDAGVYNIKITATDGTSSDSKTFKVTVNNLNRAPVLAAISDSYVNENELVSITASATDPDNDELTYSINDSRFVQDILNKNIFTWQTTYTDSGTYTVKITATDGTLSDTKTFKVTVNNLNRAPVLAAISDISVNEAELVTITASAADPDGDFLTYSINDGRFTKNVGTTNIFTWQTDYNSKGTYNLAVTVNDGSLSDTKTFTVYVSDTNRLPSVNSVSISPEIVYSNDTLTCLYQFTDADGDIDLSTVNWYVNENHVQSGKEIYQEAAEEYSFEGNYMYVNYAKHPEADSASWKVKHGGLATYDIQLPQACFDSSDTLQLRIYSNFTVSKIASSYPECYTGRDWITIGKRSSADDGYSNCTSSYFTLDSNKAYDGSWTTYITNVLGIWERRNPKASCAANIYEEAITWKKGSILLTPDLLSPNSNVSCKVVPNDGKAEGIPVEDSINILNRAPVLTEIDDMALDENSLVIITLTRADSDNDAITYAINDTRFIQDSINKNIFTWQTTYNDAGTYNIKITATDGTLSDTKTFKVTINNANRAIVLDNIPDININETEIALITAHATDLDGDSISYSINDSRFTQQDNLFGWQTSYTDAGTYNLKITATDGTATDTKAFMLTVKNVNRNPVLAPLSDIAVDESQLVTITAAATDQDNDELTYSINDTRFVKSSSANNIFTWQTSYNDAGIYNLKLTATDLTDSDSKVFRLNVSNVNRKPTLAALSDIAVDESQLVTITAAATDPDNDAITYAINDTRFVKSSSANNVFTWQTTYDDAGTYNIKIFATDGTLSDSQTLKVTVNNVNRAPVLQSITDMTLDEGNLAEIFLSATDPDGQAIIYTINDSRFIYSSNRFTRQLTYEDAGEYNLKITASDSSLSDTKTLKVTVNNVNRAPVLNAISDLSVSENQLVTITASATDPDNDAITYSINDSRFTQDSINKNRYTWQTSYDDAGTYNIKIFATDGTLSDSKTLKVSVNNFNRAPVLNQISDLTVSENQLATIIALATDPDNNTLTFSINDSRFIQDDNSNNLFTWQTSYDNAGVYNIKITATDGTLSDSKILKITVNNINRAPSLEPITNIVKNEADEIVIVLAATDPDNDALIYSANDSRFIQNRNFFTWQTTYSDSGQYNVKFSVTDGIESVSKTATLTINNINRAPVLVSAAPQSDYQESEDNMIEFTPQFTDPDGDTLTYSWHINNILIDETSSKLTQYYDYDSTGRYSIRVTATDGSLAATNDWSLAITNKNRLPVISNIATQPITLSPGLQSCSYDYYDADGDKDYSQVKWQVNDAEVEVGYDVYQEDADAYSFADNFFYATYGKPAEASAAVWKVRHGGLNPYEIEVPASCFNNSKNLQLRIFSQSAFINRQRIALSYPQCFDGGWKNIGELNTVSGKSYTCAGFISQNTDKASDGNWDTYITNDFGSWQRSNTRTACAANIYEESITWHTTNNVINMSMYTQQNVSCVILVSDGYDNSSVIGDSPVPSEPIRNNSGNAPGNETAAPNLTLPNTQPVLEPIADRIINENERIVITVNADDSEGEALQYSINDTRFVQDSMIKNVFTWQTTYTDAGTYNLQITVSDGHLSDSKAFKVTVNNVNRAPMLATINDLTLSENSLATITASATDPDNDAITYTINNTRFVKNSSSNNIFTWQTSYDDAGIYNLKIIATDGALEVYQNIKVTIENTNRAPIIEIISPINRIPGDSIFVTINATDLDNDLLSYAINDSRFSKTDNQFSWYTSKSDQGTYNFLVTVSDGNVFSTMPFNVILTPNPNSPPTLSIINDLSAEVNTEIIINASASDPDDDRLIYTINDSRFTQNSLTQNYALFAWTPQINDVGSYNFKITVSDGEFEDSTTFKVTVNASPQPPAPPEPPLLPEPPADNPGNITANPDNSTDPMNETDDLLPETPPAPPADNPPIENPPMPEPPARINHPPILQTRMPSSIDINVDEDSFVAFNIEYSDTDGDNLTYSWYSDNILIDESSEGINSDANSATNPAALTKYYGYESAGQHQITSVVSDGEFSSTISWAINVQDKNRLPSVTDVELTASSRYTDLISCTYDYHDADRDADRSTLKWYVDNVEVPVGYNIYQESADTYLIEGNYFYMDYIKPSEADSAVWKVKHGGLEAYEIRIPQSCFDYNDTIDNADNYNTDKLKLRIYAESKRVDRQSISLSYPQCYDGEWQDIGQRNANSGRFYFCPGYYIQQEDKAYDGNWDTYQTNDYGRWQRRDIKKDCAANVYEEAITWHTKNNVINKSLYLNKDNTGNNPPIGANLSCSIIPYDNKDYGTIESATIILT
ncbi:TPA: S8 family serine peptidase [Candidatus Woesearchaeota archaeon]|nr:S8 family serine peptidase [Candidatus Woesearchaeota archaeon]